MLTKIEATSNDLHIWTEVVSSGSQSKCCTCSNFPSLAISVVQVDSKEGKLRLTPLQTFAIETRDLLKHLDGCVSLNRFAPNFQQLYGRPCKAADYGLTRISEVIDIISNVAEVRGKGAEKMVVLVDENDVTLPVNQGKAHFAKCSRHRRIE